MSRYYESPKETGREFVDYCSQLCSTTIHRCILLPKRWDATLLNPLISTTQKIEELVTTANSIYINKNNLSHDEYINNYKKRLNKLTEAFDYFKLFDIQFERLMRQISLEKSETYRLEGILRNLISKKNDENEDLNITISRKNNSYQYESKSGKEFLTLKLTNKNVENWLYVRNNANDFLSKRISLDRKTLNKELKAC